MAALTQARLKELLHYNPETGIFTNREDINSMAKKGDRSGCVANGRGCRTIRINKVGYRANRLAWLYMEGYFPEFHVGRKNGIGSDDRWCNLRHVSEVCNSQNRKTMKRNTSGYTGVFWIGRDEKWRAELNIGMKTYYLGYYPTPLDAALARITAEDCHPEYKCDYICENRKKVFADLKRSILDSKRDSTP